MVVFVKSLEDIEVEHLLARIGRVPEVKHYHLCVNFAELDLVCVHVRKNHVREAHGAGCLELVLEL